MLVKSKATIASTPLPTMGAPSGGWSVQDGACSFGFLVIFQHSAFRPAFGAILQACVTSVRAPNPKLSPVAPYTKLTEKTVLGPALTTVPVAPGESWREI